MSTFNASKYDPTADSSPDAAPAVRANYPRDLILVLDHNACECGCGELPSGKRSRFRQGHDARIRGMLIRAAAASARVVTVDEANGHTTTYDPIEYAATLDTETHRLSEQVQRGVQRIADRGTTSKPAPVTVIAKVGRWPREGIVDGAEFVYTEKASGTVQRTRNFTVLQRSA